MFWTICLTTHSLDKPGLFIWQLIKWISPVYILDKKIEKIEIKPICLIKNCYLGWPIYSPYYSK